MSQTAVPDDSSQAASPAVLTPLANVSKPLPSVAAAINPPATSSTAASTWPSQQPTNPSMLYAVDIDRYNGEQMMLLRIFFLLVLVFAIYLFCMCFFDSIVINKDGITFNERKAP